MRAAERALLPPYRQRRAIRVGTRLTLMRQQILGMVCMTKILMESASKESSR